MSKNLEVGVKITADGKGLATEARAAKDELNQLGDSTRKVSNESAALTSQTTAQTASMASMKTGLIAAAGAYVSFSSAMAGGKALIETALANERLNNTLIVATGSAEAAARETAFLREESEKLGLQYVANSSQYAKLAAAAKGTALEGQATRDIFLAVSKAATVLGMSVADASGSLLAIQQMISKGKVSAEELRGQFGERVPGAFEMAARAIGVTTAELDKMLEQGQVTAERLLPALAKELEATYGAQAQTSAQGLNAKINRLDNSFTDLKTTIGNTGLIDLLSDGIVLATRFVDALSGAKVLSAVDAQKQKIIEMRAELESLGNRKHIPLIGDLLFDKKQADLLSQRIDDGIADLKKLENAAQQSAEALSGKKAVTPGAKPELPKEWAAAAEKAASAREKAAAAAEREMQRMVDGSTRTIAALKLETEQIGLNAIQKKMLVAATEAAKAPTQELAQEIMASAQAWALATQRQEELASAEKDRLEGIKAVEKAEQDAARAAEESARQTQQQWNQTWSSMEQTGKNAFTQFAAHGKSALGSIKESLKLSVIDLLYQVTARPWIIQLGASLQSSFVGASGASGANALNALNLGSGTLNLIKSGFGTSSLIRSGLGAIGLGASSSASAGVFGAGGLSYLGGAGTAIGGSSLGAGGTVAASAAEFGSMASMGSAFAAAAGPAIAIAAVDQITRLLAGDKLIGGGVGKVLNYVPVLGPLLNGLFGRGPMKQQGTLLSGEIGAEGFESGYLQTRFKAKGGLFRSDKIDYASVDAMTGQTWTDNRKLQGFADDLAKTAREVFGLINDTTKQTSTSLRQIGKDLGISTEGIDKFGYSLSILSDKGKMLTEEQIGQEIEKITDGLARSLLPQVDELAKRGETALQTVARLGNEFTTLVSATALVLGKSSADAKAMISGGTYQGRTAFVDAAGGLDALNQKVAFFADNFLTDAQRLAPAQEQLNTGLKTLGLSTDLTRDQFRDLVQSFGTVNGISEDTLQSLLNLAPAFVQVRTASDQLAAVEKQRATDAAGTAFGELQKSVGAVRTSVANEYNTALDAVNTRIQSVTDSVGKLKNLSDALKATVSQLRPMSRDAAKQQIQDAIAAARAGGALPEADSLREALSTLGRGAPGFAGSFEYAREQAKTAILVADLGKLTDDQLTLDERSLAALEAQRDRLTEGFKAETARLDGLLTQGQAQVDALAGIDAGIASLADALRQFNAASYSAGGGTIGGESLGNPAISAQQIRDYVSTPGITEMDIYNAAKANGVGFEQYAAATGANITDLYAWADARGLPRFAKGGFHRGGLRIVGEKGPELESTGPSRITSNNDLANLLNNDDVVGQLKILIAKLDKNNEHNKKVVDKLDALTIFTNGRIALRTGTE